MSKKLTRLHFTPKEDCNVELTATLLSIHLELPIEQTTAMLKQAVDKKENFTTALVEEESLSLLIEDASAFGFTIAATSLLY